MLTRSFTSAVLLCALAGTTVSAQSPINDSIDYSKMLFQQATPPAGYRENSASREVVQFIYEIASPSDANIAGTQFGNGGSTLAFDLAHFRTFDPLQAVPDPVPVSSIAFGWVWSGQTDGNFDVLITFFANADLNSTDATAPFYSNVLGTARVTGITPPAVPAGRQITQWFQNGLGFVDANGNPAVFNLPRDADFGYEIRFLNPGTDVLFTQNGPLQHFVKGGPLQPVTGTSDPRRWFDGAPGFDGILTPAESSGTALNRRDVYLKLRADINPPPPPNVVVLGAVDCNGAGAGTLTRTVTINPGEVSFYSFSIPSGASAAANTFLDISVSDGGFGFVNADVALYGADGNRIAIDRDSGALTDAQLSFGHGRRPAIGDGAKFDGSAGDLAAGNFFLAVGGAGASFGSSSFDNNGASTIDMGDVTITITTNVGSAGGCPLPTPIEPDAIDIGTLAAGPTINSFQPAFGQVVWYKFVLPYSIDSTQPQNFLDIDNLGSENTTSDIDLALYDNLGNLVAFNNNSGPGAFAQLSFGDPAAHNAAAAGDGEPYNAQDGSVLPAGTYWAVASLAALDAQPTGWQARTNTGSSNIINVNFRTPSGCNLDLNGDGNVDPDDLSDAISCFFDPTCVFDFDASGFEDPDDLSTYISGFFSGCQ